MMFGIRPLGKAINDRKLPFSVFSVVIELRFLRIIFAGYFNSLRRTSTSAR